MRVSDAVVSERLSGRSRVGELLPGALITAVVTLLFFSIYWNKFAGLRSGNGSFLGGMALLQGYLPYRDFFTAAPPLDGLMSAAVLSVFGQKLIAIRAWGVVERIALGWLLYFCLIRVCRTTDAAFASILAVIVSAGDPSDTLSSYGIEAIFFFLLSGWAVMRAGEAIQSTFAFNSWAIAAGLFASMSFGTKQTLGAGATVGIPLVACIYLIQLSATRSSGIQRSLLFLAAFAGGWCAFAGAVLLWLTQAGLLHNFLQDVFKTGPSAKASHPSDFGIRAIRTAWGLRYGFLAACVGLAFGARALLRGSGATDRRAGAARDTVLVGAIASLVLSIGVALSYAGLWPLQNFCSFAIYFGLFGTVLLLLRCAPRLVPRTLAKQELQIAFLAAISFGVALMVSLSWPASYHMVFPAFGLVTAVMLNGSSPRQRLVIYTVGALMIFAMACEKINLPQGFHEWAEPAVRFAKTPSSLPALSGIMLPSATAQFIDETGRIVREHSGPGDTIFVYPEFGILYSLYDRRYPTATDSHNIDVVNDEFARSEAQRLLKGKPAVIIYDPVPEWSLRADEKVWRHGQRSGQRDIIAAIEKLTAGYQLVKSFRVPPNENPVQVYVRQ